MSGIVHHHAVRTKSPCQGADAAHHHLDPLARQTIAISIVVRWNDRLFQGLIEAVRIPLVGDSIVGVACALTYREAIGAVVRLSPPSIEDAAVETTVEDRLLTARSRGFQWASWVVEPYVDPWIK